MRKLTIATSLLFAVSIGLMTAPSLYAQGDQPPAGQKDDQRMMRGGMMGQGGMGGMMNMMQQMSRMMDHCNKMMSDRSGDSDRDRPNDNWRKDGPATPDKKG
jgi:hypothetical protein